MKKAMMYLLVLALVLVAPFSVNAASKLSISDKPIEETESEDKKTVTKVYEIFVSTTEEGENIEKAEVAFTYGKAITEFTCGSASPFEVDQDGSGNKATCVYQTPKGQSGEKIKLGTVTVVAKVNAPDEDCVIQYTYNGAEGKINPPTGAEVPYAYIVGGLVLAAGVYFVTKKKSALHRI